MKIGMIVECEDQVIISDVMTLRECRRNEFRAIHNGNVTAIHVYKFDDDDSQEEFDNAMGENVKKLGGVLYDEDGIQEANKK